MLLSSLCWYWQIFCHYSIIFKAAASCCPCQCHFKCYFIVAHIKKKKLHSVLRCTCCDYPEAFNCNCFFFAAVLTIQFWLWFWANNGAVIQAALPVIADRLTHLVCCDGDVVGEMLTPFLWSTPLQGCVCGWQLAFFVFYTESTCLVFLYYKIYLITICFRKVLLLRWMWNKCT